MNNYMQVGDITKEQMLKQLGDKLSDMQGIKPKDARRAIQRAMKKASYQQWLDLYNDTFYRGGK